MYGLSFHTHDTVVRMVEFSSMAIFQSSFSSSSYSSTCLDWPFFASPYEHTTDALNGVDGSLAWHIMKTGNGSEKRKAGAITPTLQKSFFKLSTIMLTTVAACVIEDTCMA